MPKISKPAKKLPKNIWTTLFKMCRRHWAFHDHQRKLCYLEARTYENGLYKWTCAGCLVKFAYSETNCDHVKPIKNGSPETREECFESLERCFVPDFKGRLQVLCKKCHNLKTRVDEANHARENNIGKINRFLNINPSPKFVESCALSDANLKKMARLIDKMKECDASIIPGAYSKLVAEFNFLAERYM